MAGDTEAPHVVEDCRGVLQVLSDGTTVRSAAAPYAVEDRDDGRVEWTDAVYHPSHGLGVCMYRPARREGKVRRRRLPVLAYFHGGGFCIGSRNWPSVHACCLRFADELPAVVLSFDYRLAPEHRLPAAHEDGAAALAWLSDRLTGMTPGPADGSGSDEGVRAWLADPGRLFVYSDSAGANIAHHMAVRFGAAGAQLGPVRTAGYVLIMPAFTSEAPTQSELSSQSSAFLSRDVAERYNRLALPAGANKDYPLMNPLGPDSPGLGLVGGRVLVVVGGDDLLKDNQVRYAERMKAVGNDVVLVVFAGKEHGFFSRGPWSETSGEVVRVVRRFMDRDTADLIQPADGLGKLHVGCNEEKTTTYSCPALGYQLNNNCDKKKRPQCN